MRAATHQSIDLHRLERRIFRSFAHFGRFGEAGRREMAGVEPRLTPRVAG